MLDTPRASSSPASSTAKGGESVEYADRFIPARRGINLQEGFALLPDTPPRPGEPGSSSASGGNAGDAPGREDLDTYSMLLRSELLGDEPASHSGAFRRGEGPDLMSPSANTNLFRYRVSPSPRDGSLPFSLSPMSAASQRATSSSRRTPRKIPAAPYKVLDAPALQDDFYLNLVDWSSSNLLAVGLGSCVYLWSACTSKVTKLCDLGADETVTSVSWAQRGSHLAIGSSTGEVQIWDAVKNAPTRTMTGHQSRVGSLAWSGHTLSSGSRDRQICMRDVRSPWPFTSQLVGHKQEVCGLKWSFDGMQLASGGNDNKLFIWSAGHSTVPAVRFTQHTAAVKALAWSPHQHGLIASGGGTADRCIRFWNTQTASALSSVDTGSQVCNLVWSNSVNELVSTHGYSQNQVVVWRYANMSKVATLSGHSTRVLYLALSPDGQTIVTGAGDETLRFWNVFPSAKPRGDSGDCCASMLDFQGRAAIR